MGANKHKKLECQRSDFTSPFRQGLEIKFVQEKKTERGVESVLCLGEIVSTLTGVITVSVAGFQDSFSLYHSMPS